MPSLANRISALEAKCDDVERRLCEKVEIASGFGEAEDQARKMRLTLKFFDTSGNGLLSYEEFFAAMTKFNLVGVQREIEALFNRYDEYVSGFVDYQEFSLRLWGLSPNAITLDVSSRAVINKLKGMLVSTGGASGYHRLMQFVKNIDGVSTGICSRDDLQYAMSDAGVAGLSKAEWESLFERFDVKSNGQVFVMEFMRYLRGGMPLSRKQLVLTVFQRLDDEDAGILKVSTILDKIDFKSFAGTIEGSANTAANEMLESFEQGGDVEGGRVTWMEFLNFFAGISLAIEDEDYFELMMRNAVKPLGGGSSTGGAGTRFAATYANVRRVKITNRDGSQQVVELNDEGSLPNIISLNLLPHLTPIDSYVNILHEFDPLPQTHLTGVEDEQFDENAILRRLIEQGVDGIVDVQIL